MLLVCMVADQSDPTVQFCDSSNTLASVCKTNTGAVLMLQIKQDVKSARPSLTFLEGKRGSGLTDWLPGMCSALTLVLMVTCNMNTVM